MAELLERLKAVVSYTKLSDRAFALSCGLKQPTLDKQLKGLRSISMDTIISVCSTYPDISRDWLIAGEGEMIKKPGQESARVNGLVDAIATLQQTINAQAETISALNARIRELENQLKSK